MEQVRTMFRVVGHVLTVLGTFIFSALRFLNEGAERLTNSGSPTKEGFDATFLPVSKVMSSLNKGFCLTGLQSLSLNDSHKHAMIIGGSGTGKTTCVLLPSIYSMARHGHSLCVHDPSGEIYQASAGYLGSMGYTVKTLHFNKAEVSDGYNPLARVETLSDAYKVATALVQNALGKSGTDAFWNSQAVGLIALMIAVLKKQGSAFRTLTNVKVLVDCFQAEPELLDLLVVRCHDEAMLKEYKNFLRTEKKVLANIISTCRSALMLFSDESVQKVTSFDSVDFDSFRREKTALFIMNKTSDLPYYAPLSATFFLQFFGHVMSSPIPRKGERSICFLIDEASSLYLPGTLQIALANLRKFSCAVMLVIQDFNQLCHLYGKPEAESIRSNCFSKVYFPNQPIETCKELEAVLGKREYEDKEGHKKTRVLLSADEIRCMDSSHALILCGSNRAIYAYMRPYYKRWNFSTYSTMAVPVIDHARASLHPVSIITNADTNETDTEQTAV